MQRLTPGVNAIKHLANLADLVPVERSSCSEQDKEIPHQYLVRHSLHHASFDQWSECPPQCRKHSFAVILEEVWFRTQGSTVCHGRSQGRLNCLKLLPFQTIECIQLDVGFVCWKLLCYTKLGRLRFLETTLGGQRQLNRGLAVTRTVCNWQLATASCRGIGMLTAIEELLDKRIGRCRLYLFSQMRQVSRQLLSSSFIEATNVQPVPQPKAA
mmetsp:Transcript_43254/g.99714  ORF Transcript_43254/g.99714 Transcript_43254/m.99714 type:complete len:213 (+) Transcript_43254:185-823(+)